MNMGPGQAKQCQLRAFLTYYINDLFLNQVCKIEVCQLDSPALGAFKTHSSFPWDERLFIFVFFFKQPDWKLVLNLSLLFQLGAQWDQQGNWGREQGGWPFEDPRQCWYDEGPGSPETPAAGEEHPHTCTCLDYTEIKFKYGVIKTCDFPSLGWAPHATFDRFFLSKLRILGVNSLWLVSRVHPAHMWALRRTEKKSPHYLLAWHCLSFVPTTVQWRKDLLGALTFRCRCTHTHRNVCLPFSLSWGLFLDRKPHLWRGPEDFSSVRFPATDIMFLRTQTRKKRASLCFPHLASL